MEPSHHQYQPLENHAIRILTLDPGQPDDRLVGALESVSIDSKGDYEALSYVWAEPGPPRSAYIIVIRDQDGKERTLALRGGSIFAALCRLRLPDRPRRIWADQCCINQDDPVERGHQVQYMNRIYRDAARVLVWLGLDIKREAALAFGLMHELHEFLGSAPIDGNPREVETERLERHVRENHEAIQALTDRAWFKRGWIVQEIGTSTPATMIWGDAAIEWDILASVCESLKRYHHLRSTLGIATSDISFLFRRFIEPDERTHHANRFNLVYELQRSRHLQFSDNRDRIFAFLGHFSVQSTHPLSCGPMSINANYTKTVERTYIDVAMQIVRTQPSAACIMLASAQHAPDSLPSRSGTDVERESSLRKWLQDEHKLPSWVPDWRTSEGIILAEPICPHRANGDSTTKLEIVNEIEYVLRIHGIGIDTVEVLSQPIHANEFYGVKSADQSMTMIEKLWHEICGKHIFDLDTDYINGGSSFFAFMQTLSNSCVQAAGHDCKLYHEIPESVWLQKAAKYIIETIGISENVATTIRTTAELIEGEWDHDKWSRWATSAADGRIFARTSKGYYVLGPAALEEGDIVCVLYGCKMPFCLRPIGSRYILVGECYVHGLMKGEALDMLARGDIYDQIFDIV